MEKVGVGYYITHLDKILKSTMVGFS